MQITTFRNSKCKSIFMCACGALFTTIPGCDGKEDFPNLVVTPECTPNTDVLVIKKSQQIVRGKFRQEPFYYWTEWADGSQTYRAVLSFSNKGEVKGFSWHENTRNIRKPLDVVPKMTWWWTNRDGGDWQHPFPQLKVSLDTSNYYSDSAAFKLSGKNYTARFLESGELEAQGKIWHFSRSTSNDGVKADPSLPTLKKYREQTEYY